MMEKRNASSFSVPLLLVFVLIFPFTWSSSAQTHQDFLRCLSLHCRNSDSFSEVIYTQNDSSYLSLLDFSAQNPRFSTPETPKPLVIVTPLEVYHIQATINCSRGHGLQIRTRSGGHDYEGLSFVSDVPFVIIDLIHLRAISVDVESKTAWVQAGSTLGELYYGIAEISRNLAFTAGTCATVGVGGHISGGGFGMLSRKYGLAADNVIDALIVDVEGRVLDRESMGEDLFWAIRGGGGASFCVIYAWKVKLVPVPSVVTVFRVRRTLEQKASELVDRWQHVGNKLPEDLSIRIFLTRANSTHEGKRTVEAAFESLFLGKIDSLISLMKERLPELGLTKEDCIETSWIESVLYFAGFSTEDSLDVLLDRIPLTRLSFKAKSDYVNKPIPEIAFRGIWKRLCEDEAELAQLIFTPYGGRMSEISETATPFPHRAGNIYEIQYLVYWREEETDSSIKYISWIRKLFSYMTPYVSKSPRTAYMNLRDLDIGVNDKEDPSYRKAKIWGVKYFKSNFNRLVRVKTRVDPANFFRNEQSIPPVLHARSWELYWRFFATKYYRQQ